MVKHIEINCFEFEEYSLKNRKRIIQKQMEQYIKLLSSIVKYVEEDNFQIDFLINEGVGEEIKSEFIVEDKENIKEDFLKKYEEVMKDFNMNTNKISFKIYRR